MRCSYMHTIHTYVIYLRYRFRIIGAASRCFFRVMIDAHVMTVITMDGMPIVPVTVGSFLLQPGKTEKTHLSPTTPPHHHHPARPNPRHQVIYPKTYNSLILYHSRTQSNIQLT